MDKKLNLESAKHLLEIYRNLTLQEIEDEFREFESYHNILNSSERIGDTIMNNITGFGCPNDCMLCSSASFLAGSTKYEVKCNYCIYHICGSHYDPENNPYSLCCINESYNEICDTRDPESLFIAVKNRADFLESVIKKIEND
jgi:hypothetical protein